MIPAQITCRFSCSAGKEIPDAFAGDAYWLFRTACHIMLPYRVNESPYVIFSSDSTFDAAKPRQRTTLRDPA